MAGIKVQVKKELLAKGIRFINTEQRSHVKLDSATTTELIKALEQVK